MALVKSPTSPQVGSAYRPVRTPDALGRRPLPRCFNSYPTRDSRLSWFLGDTDEPDRVRVPMQESITIDRQKAFQACQVSEMIPTERNLLSHGSSRCFLPSKYSNLFRSAASFLMRLPNAFFIVRQEYLPKFVHDQFSELPSLWFPLPPSHSPRTVLPCPSSRGHRRGPTILQW